MRPSDEVIACLRETLGDLRRVVTFGEGSALAMDPAVLLPTQFAATFTLDRELTLLACRNEQWDDDVLKYRDLATSGSPVAALSADHDAACASSPRWQQLLLPRGRRQELRAALVDARGVCWGAVALYRSDRRRFTSADLAAVRRLVPDLAARLARAMVRDRAPGLPGTPTSLVMTEEGRIVGAPDAVTRWIAAMHRTDEVDRVAMLLASLAAFVRRRRPEPVTAPVQVRMRSAGGAWTTLSAEPMSSAEFGEAISVVVMPTDSLQLFPLQVAAYGLSRRETEVVAHALEGLDTRSIAASLSISSLTVQDHFKSIFKKTDVTSRRELTHRLGVTARDRPAGSG